MKSPATTAPAALPVPGPEVALDLSAPVCRASAAASAAASTAGPSEALAAAVGAHPVPRPRADAVRNRERILAAAREVLVEFGPAAPSTRSPAGRAWAMPRSTGTFPTGPRSSTTSWCS